MILKTLVTATKVTVTASRFVSAASAIIYVSYGLYCFFGNRRRKRRGRVKY